MQTLELLIQLVEAVAWPGTILLIVLIFKQELVQMLPSVKKVRAGPVEAEFEQGIAKISQVGDWELPETEGSGQASSRRDELLDLARVNPRMAIIDAWQGIELSLKKATLQRFGGDSPPPNVSSPISMIRELAKEGSLASADVTLLHELRGLRNQATHLPEYGPSFESVAKYIDIAVRAQEKLDELAELNT